MIQADTLQTAPTASRSGVLPEGGHLVGEGDLSPAERRHLLHCSLAALGMILFLMIVGGALNG